MPPGRGSIDVGRERRLRGARRPVLEDRDLSGLAPSEGGDGEIVLAVAVEIGGLDVGDTRPAVEPEGAELALAEPAEPDHGALAVIRRKELAEIGDEQILDAVAIDVGQRDVRGVRDARDDRQRAACLRRPAGEDQPLPHVGAEHVEPLVAVEIDEPDVRDGRRAGHVRHASGRAARTGRATRWWPARVPAPGDARARGWCRTGAPAPCPAAAESCGRPCRRTDRRQPVFADEHHPDELVAPGVSREDVRRRKRVAPAARDARLLLVALDRRRRLGLLVKRRQAASSVERDQRRVRRGRGRATRRRRAHAAWHEAWNRMLDTGLPA